MFKKVLVANRGEVALRVISACRELGIQTVAVYSQADADLPHVRFADEAVCIGPARPSASYLNIPSVISAAEVTGVDAVHPGYGFLSENPKFAEVCDACGISFIGPAPELIRLMGDKSRARARMKEAGLPVLPGSDGPVNSPEEAAEWAAAIGYPVMLKPVAGANGRAMRCVQEPCEMPAAFEATRKEAAHGCFCDGVYVEKFIPRARHIEFQVLMDNYGDAAHLGERECSVQRNYRKLLEEGPAVSITSERRQQLGVSLARVLGELGYTNACSLEFLMDEEKHLFFIEANTRIQAEDPVTEMLAGIDIVKTQILLAAGASLSEIVRTPVNLRGHSIQCRIIAEDPVRFTPASGKVQSWQLPGGTGVRVDTGAYVGYALGPYSDPLLAKLIVHGRNRDEAINRMLRALDMFVIEGVKTNIPLHKRILADEDFRSGEYHVGFLDRFLPHRATPRTAPAALAPKIA